MKNENIDEQTIGYKVWRGEGKYYLKSYNVSALEAKRLDLSLSPGEAIAKVEKITLQWHKLEALNKLRQEL
ncbi:hypothetical protein LCGC14_1207390 [marine sediment metagenome]|uniref:Uncharacterized protein n=1 Tax=marine sediment metagenome TaxID=412755 RepID=A0A0F9PJR6_9ZZZZ